MDGRGTVAQHVARAKELGYKAMALTDHGTMAGVAELYRECRKNGIEPLPGIEAYAAYRPKSRTTFHLGLVALTPQGYLNLVAINNQMMKDFYYKPILDLSRLDGLDTEGVALTTGCFFGLALSAHRADPEASLNVIATLAEYFDVYVEAQVHGISDDDHNDIEDQLTVLQWSKDLGLPLVLGQDCHYVYPQERQLHDTMKRLGSWSDDPDSAIFPGSYGYSMIDSATARKQFEPEVWAAGMEGMGRILSKASVVIPPLDKFDPIIINRHDEDEVIKSRVFGSSRMPDAVDDEYATYANRITEELGVIEQFGFTGYMLLVADITAYLREQRIAYNIRGSASGSLVCYLLGISNIDPIEWAHALPGLGFDRFLSRNRAKLPDIDIDVDSSKRDKVIEHLRRTYVVTSICNYGELGIVEYDGIFKGSALQKWKQSQRKGGHSEVPDRYVFEELRLMCYNGAVISTRGKHASGLVVAPDYTAMKWMPMAVVGSAKDPKDRMLTAFDMDSTEAMGYIKVDILGLKALCAVDIALQEIAKTGRVMTLDDIPLDDENVYAVLGDGMTEGVFQLEGLSAKYGMKRMRPKNIWDIIASMALFRPAALDSGATTRYLKRLHASRTANKPADPTKGFHPDIADVIRPTYGELIYQEQVIEILKALQFGPDELSDALKIVKASNNKVANAVRMAAELMKDVEARAKARGWSKTDIDWMATAFDAYANYGFNLAHAMSYGLLAYQTAWLIYHYPGEFWQGMITAHGADDEKVREYTNQLGKRRFTKMAVDVNLSGLEIRVDKQRRMIFPSLTSLHGIGEKVAAEIAAKAPYEDLHDLTVKLAGTRVSGIAQLADGVPPAECKGVVGILHKEGALRSLV